MRERAASLSSFFNPRSVAVIGASNDIARIGGRPLHGMRMCGFTGGVYPVNPRYREVMGMACYASLNDIPDPVELALIALPAAQVADTLAQCVKKSVRAVSVFSSGFAELGETGATAQAMLAKLSQDGRMRLLGPNCMGTMNTSTGMIGTFTSTISEAPVPGPISIVSQSGAFAAHCFMLLRDRGVGVDLWAATGNQGDVEIAECIEYMAASPSTRAIIACVEGIRDARSFVDALAFAEAARKPVVLVKLGGSAVGAAAVASHTAALAGSDRVFDAVLRQYGVHRAHSVDELIDIAYTLGMGRTAHSRTIGIASVSGGFGIMMADAAEAVALALPELPAETQEKLRALVPFAGTRNPVDLTAQFINDPALIEPMMDALLAGTGFGSVVLFLGASGQIPALFDRLAPGLERIASRYADRALALCLIAHPDTRAMLQSWGYLVFEDPTRTVRALAALAHFSDRPVTSCTTSRPILEAVDLALAGPLPACVNEWQAKSILRGAGIPAVEGRMVSSADEAVVAARELGYPVAMKILSPDILHKTDTGCVVLNLRDDDAVTTAYARISANAGSESARIDGMLVEPMVGDGIEMILGIQHDAVFGPVIIVGLGGLFVEVLRDTVLRVAPFDVDDAHAMLRELKGFAILDGARGRRYDVDGLAEVLCRLSRFAVANAHRIETLDINPFLVRESGGVALDAVIGFHAASSTVS